MYGAIGSSMLAGFLLAKLTQRTRGSAAKLRKLTAKVFEDTAFPPADGHAKQRTEDFMVHDAWLYPTSRSDGEIQKDIRLHLLLRTTSGYSMFPFVDTIPASIVDEPNWFSMDRSSLERYNKAISSSHSIGQARKVARELRDIFTGGAPLVGKVDGKQKEILRFQGSPYTFKQVGPPALPRGTLNLMNLAQVPTDPRLTKLLDKTERRTFSQLTLNRTLGRLISQTSTFPKGGNRKIAWYGLVKSEGDDSVYPQIDTTVFVPTANNLNDRFYDMLCATDGNLASATVWPRGTGTLLPPFWFTGISSNYAKPDPNFSQGPFFTQLLRRLELQLNSKEPSFLDAVSNFPPYYGSGAMTVLTSFTMPKDPSKAQQVKSFAVTREGSNQVELASNFQRANASLDSPDLIKVFDDHFSNRQDLLLSVPFGLDPLVMGPLPNVSILVFQLETDSLWTCSYNHTTMAWDVSITQGQAKKPKPTQTKLKDLLKLKKAMFRLRIEYTGYELPWPAPKDVRRGTTYPSGDVTTRYYVFENGLQAGYVAHLVDMMATGMLWFVPQHTTDTVHQKPSGDMKGKAASGRPFNEPTYGPMCFLYRPIDGIPNKHTLGWFKTFDQAVQHYAPDFRRMGSPATSPNLEPPLKALQEWKEGNIPDKDVVEKIFSSYEWTDHISAYPWLAGNTKRGRLNPAQKYFPEQFLPHSTPLMFIDVDTPITWCLIMPMRQDWGSSKNGYSVGQPKKAKKNG